MVESNSNLGKEKIEQTPLLRDLLAEYTFKPGRAISPEIKSIDLGVFHEEAMQLANNCFLDSENKNFGKMVFVTGQKKVLVPINFFKSDSSGNLSMQAISSFLEKEIAGKEKLNILYPVMPLHSFGNTDWSFSPTDLMLLLLKDSHPAASVASLIAGKTKNKLFLRSQSTPQIDLEEVEKKANLWERQLEERAMIFTNPEMSEEEILNVVNKAEESLMKQICVKYDIQFFSGETSDNIVTKQTF
jgi:hypothetical protein